MREINEYLWKELRQKAVQVMEKAYVPYSHYPVGAAALCTDEKIYTGCNAENASYGVGLCAECGLIGSIVKHQAGKILAFCCVNKNEEIIVPCGRCRQLLWEHAHEDMLIWMPSGIMPMSEALPEAFGPKDLAKLN